MEGIYIAKGERPKNKAKELGFSAREVNKLLGLIRVLHGGFHLQWQAVTGYSPTPRPPSRTCGFPNIFCRSKDLGLFFSHFVFNFFLF